MNRVSKSVRWFVSSYPPRPNGREFGCATPTLDRWTAQKGQTFHVALWATSHRRVARGITTVALNEEGEIVEHRPDGTSVVLTVKRRPPRRRKVNAAPTR